MTLPELSIKRHVLAWMLSGVLVLFGIIGLHQAEMDHKLTYGTESLFDAFETAGVNELLDIHRPSTKP